MQCNGFRSMVMQCNGFRSVVMQCDGFRCMVMHCYGNAMQLSSQYNDTNLLYCDVSLFCVNDLVKTETTEGAFGLLMELLFPNLVGSYL